MGGTDLRQGNDPQPEKLITLDDGNRIGTGIGDNIPNYQKKLLSDTAANTQIIGRLTVQNAGLGGVLIIELTSSRAGISNNAGKMVYEKKVIAVQRVAGVNTELEVFSSTVLSGADLGGGADDLGIGINANIGSGASGEEQIININASPGTDGGLTGRLHGKIEFLGPSGITNLT